MTLRDPFGRKVTGLRIAITSRCNMSCLYCHHEGEEPGEGSREMSAGEIAKVIRAGADLGVKRIKFTGGEPLLRADLESILERLPEGLEISLTTNGTLLAERAKSLAEAGLGRVNVSLDSLRPRVYSRITGGTEEDLRRVLLGIDAAIEAGLVPVKVNMVVLKENEDEVWDMVEFARGRGVILQLIEQLDLSGSGLGGDLFRIERELEDRADRIVTRDLHRRRKYFIDDAEVEVVRPIDNTEFCANCTRLRVTSDGKLKPCLLRNDNLVNLGSADLEETKRLIEKATLLRSPYFCEGQKPSR
ncbi:MAG: cyclic pyranopterin phosphate synthase MoaA [Methanosaeta sp. SDB]|nr:MAG: cyclic pyranopterin phosphate synthase MoaA [Methanosaeta sp. SDB]